MAGNEPDNARGLKERALEEFKLYWIITLYPPLMINTNVRSIATFAALVQLKDYRAPTKGHLSFWHRLLFGNPKGILSSSPGLRGTSYPGFGFVTILYPNGVVACFSRSFPQPRWG